MNTKMIKKVSIALMILTFLTASSVMAGESKTEFITGTIVTTDQGFALSTNSGDEYMVKGADVSNMVGQKVNVTGTVQEDDSGKSIKVNFIEVAPSSR